MDGFISILDEMKQLFPDDPVELPPRPSPSPRRRGKRKRGGQTGNTNARTHGAYSPTLTEEEMKLYLHLITEENIEAELAIIRVKFDSFFHNAPDNKPAMKHLVKLLIRYCRDRYCMSRSNARILEGYLEIMIEQKAQLYIFMRDYTPPQDDEAVKTNHHL